MTKAASTSSCRATSNVPYTSSNTPNPTGRARATCLDKPVYGRSTQLVTPTDDFPLLDEDGILCVQSITSTALVFYARAVDPTALVAIGAIFTKQSKATRKTSTERSPACSQVLCHPSKRLHQILLFRHGTLHPFRRLLPLRAQCSQPHGRAFLPKQTTN